MQPTIQSSPPWLRRVTALMAGGIMLLVAATGVRAQAYPFPLKGDQSQAEPPDLDVSGANDMEIKFRWKLGRTNGASYIPNLCGVENRNIVTFGLVSSIRSWLTYPQLDTTFNVPWTQIANVMPFEYDGVPPTEYITSTGTIFQCNGDLLPVDRVDTVRCIDDDRWLADADGDGLDDIVTTTYAPNPTWFRVTFAGADRGKGCERTVHVPNPYAEYYSAPYVNSTTMRPVRCGDGKFRFVMVGQAYAEERGVYLIEADFQRTDTGYVVNTKIADQIAYDMGAFEPGAESVARGHIIVNDTIRNRQYLVVLWYYGWHRAGQCLAVYDITNGRLEEIAVTKPFSSNIYSFDTDFDDGAPVVRYTNGTGTVHYARIPNIHQPFAKHPFIRKTGVGRFIDDQYNDGSRDLFCTYELSSDTTSEIVLINFDLNTTSVARSSAASDTSWAWIDGKSVVVKTDSPVTVLIDLVDINGRSTPFVSTVVTSGQHRFDIQSRLDGMPAGAHFVRVKRSDGDVITLPIIR